MTEEKKETPKRTRTMKTIHTGLTGGTSEARRMAAVVLEVLGGARTAPSGAEALGVSLPRFYALEARAVAGLVAACEARPRRGKAKRPEAEIASLRRELERVRRERDRAQALLRASHRLVGVAPPRERPAARGKRRRRPIARALKAAEVLHSPPPEAAAPTVAPPSAE